MDTFLNLARYRYSVRNYEDRAVEDEKLEYILECGRIAPSAANFQPWHIIVIRDMAMKQALQETYSRPWLVQAPVLLVICGDHKEGWRRKDGKDHTDIDIAILIDHMTLAAAEKELGTCWICNFDAQKCSGILHLPSHIEPIAYLPVGYPGTKSDDKTRHLVRKSMDEIVHWEKFR